MTNYTGCKTNEGKNCASAGKTKGKITTEELEGELTSQPGSASGTGEIVKPKSGSVLAAYNCEGIEITAKGSVEGEVIGATTETSAKTEYLFAATKEGKGVFQRWGFPPENEKETYESFKAMFEGKGPAGHVILSEVKIPSAKKEFTLPATQQSKAAVTSELFKIV